MVELGPGRLEDGTPPDVLIFSDAKLHPVGSCVAGTNIGCSALFLGIFLMFGSSRDAAALSKGLMEPDGWLVLELEMLVQGKGCAFLGTTEMVLI